MKLYVWTDVLPLAWLAARTWLAAGRCFWRQRDHTPIWPKP